MVIQSGIAFRKRVYICSCHHYTLLIDRNQFNAKMNFVEAKLQEWNLQDLLPVFEENEIDEEAFRLLDEETIKELVTKAGQKIKFLANFRKFQKEENNGNVMELPATPSRLISANPSAGVVTPASTHTSGFSSPDCSPSYSESRNESSGSPYFTHNFQEILKATLKGETLHCMLTRNEILLILLRKEMVRILVAYMMQRYGSHPSAEVKVAFAKALVENYKSLRDSEREGYEAWYSKGQYKVPAMGYLEERLKNVRKRPKQLITECTPKQGPKACSRNKRLSNRVIPEADVSEERAAEMTSWLKHNKEPPAQVSEFMLSTVASRAKLVKENTSLSFAKLAQQYPRLVDVEGMVEQDFLFLYPDDADGFCEMWQEPVADRLIKFINASRPDWQNLLRVEDEDLLGDNKTSIALMALPLAFGVPAFKERNKMIRLTYSAALKAFINVKPNTNIPEYLKNSSMHPHILVLGKTKDVDAEYFVIVEGHALKRDTLVKAVDTCFKIFYICDLQYPVNCVMPWQAIQTICYSILQENVYPAVRALRKVLLG